MGKLSSYFTFLALVGYLAIVKLLLTYVGFPDSMFPHPSQRDAFSWESILGLVLIPGLGLHGANGPAVRIERDPGPQIHEESAPRISRSPYNEITG